MHKSKDGASSNFHAISVLRALGFASTSWMVVTSLLIISFFLFRDAIMDNKQEILLIIFKTHSQFRWLEVVVESDD
jgi:hypothetical protein